MHEPSCKGWVGCDEVAVPYNHKLCIENCRPRNHEESSNGSNTNDKPTKKLQVTIPLTQSKYTENLYSYSIYILFSKTASQGLCHLYRFIVIDLNLFHGQGLVGQVTRLAIHLGTIRPGLETES